MEILDYIICDDIREELARKFTLVGTYNDKVVFERKAEDESFYPRPIRLSVFSKLVLEESEKDITSIKVTVKDANSDDVFHEQVFELTESHPWGVPFPYLGNKLFFKLSPGQAIQIELQSFKGDDLVSTIATHRNYVVEDRLKS